jgi:hypothetical protein
MMSQKGSPQATRLGVGSAQIRMGGWGPIPPGAPNAAPARATTVHTAAPGLIRYLGWPLVMDTAVRKYLPSCTLVQ